MITSRLERLRARMEEEKLDCFWVGHDPSRRYLSGFAGSAGHLFITRTEAVLATDFRYTEQATHQAPDYRVLRIMGRLDWLPKLFQELGAKRVGYEAHYVTVAALKRYEEVLSKESERPALVPTTGIVEKLRLRKDAEETRLLQRAIDITDQALDLIAPTVHPGERERDVAWRLEKAIRELGGYGLSFDTIVAAGPNGALAHHMPDDTVLREGQPLVIDMGALYAGFHADQTRTICVGQPDAQFWKIYDIVHIAQRAAMELVRPGMTGRQADELARKVITEAGHGDAFGHSLGHGVGLETHEAPHVGPGSEDTLEAGDIFTIEPGIYISGWGGVRIEDVVILEPNGARCRRCSPAKAWTSSSWTRISTSRSRPRATRRRR